MKFIKSLLTTTITLSISTTVFAENGILSNMKENVKSSIASEIDSAKAAIAEKTNAVRTSVSEKVNAIKSFPTENMDSINNSVNEKVNSEKTETINKINEVKSSAPNATTVNINTANIKQLKQLMGINSTKAKAIIAYRNKVGSFTSIEQLRNVSGVSNSIIKNNQSRIILK